MSFSDFEQHTHNGIDSPQISYNNLLDKPSSSSGWTLISTQELAADAANITFSDIPTMYKQLRISGYLEQTNGAAAIHIRFNNEAGNTTSYGIATLSAGVWTNDGSYGPLPYVNLGSLPTTLLVPFEMFIQNGSATIAKTGRFQVSTDFDSIRFGSFKWNNTSSKITSITIEVTISNITQNSRLVLEGI